MINEKLNNDNSVKNIVVNSLEESKADNIQVIELAGKSSFCNYMIIATGHVNKHVKSIADRLIDDLEAGDIFDVKVEGEKESNWIIIDIDNVVVNIFRPESRESYNLEGLWDSKK